MVDRVEIPLSVLNNVPGVSNVEDVVFDVPQVEDLEEIVDDAVLGLEDVTDVGVLYDHWYGQEDIPLALVRIKAEIDLDEVFAAREVEGTVETIKHGRDE